MNLGRHLTVIIIILGIITSGCDQVQQPVPEIPYHGIQPTYYFHGPSSTNYAINRNGIFACINDTVKKLYKWENTYHESIIMLFGTGDTLPFVYSESGTYFLTEIGDTMHLTNNTTFYCNSSNNVQDILNGGTTPFTLYQMGIPMDSIYGKYYVGGKIAFLDTATGSGLVAAPYDQSTNCYWGCSGTLISGADASTYGSGMQNTIDILAGCSTLGIAAEICSNLSLGGYSDWHLPSKDELNLVYLRKDQIGGFLPMYYWSSTEYDSMSAWKQYFVNGYQTNYHKETNYKLRAVRYF